VREGLLKKSNFRLAFGKLLENIVGQYKNVRRSSHESTFVILKKIRSLCESFAVTFNIPTFSCNIKYDVDYGVHVV